MTRSRWIALVVLVVIGIGLLVAVVAIPWGDDAPAAQAPKVYHQGDSIDVAVGEEFVVALPATPSTGYTWTAAGNPDVTFVSTHQVQGGSQPGAAGTQEMTFEGRQAGESQLVFTYARSFERSEPPAKTAKLPLTVTK
jgi:inhibitor of cysteine peptidase